MLVTYVSLTSLLGGLIYFWSLDPVFYGEQSLNYFRYSYPRHVCLCSDSAAASSRRLMAASFHADLSQLPAAAVARAQAWPKVELHLHLDGSLSPAFIARRALVR